jgi:hypothetical protein
MTIGLPKTGVDSVPTSWKPRESLPRADAEAMLGSGMAASNTNAVKVIVAESSDLVDEAGLAQRLKVARSTLQNRR